MTSTPALPIAIVVFDDAQILDVAGPMEVLRGANLALRSRPDLPHPGYEVRIFARAAGPVRTSCGLTIVATHAFANPRAPIDTLIVAGGVMDDALRDEALLDFVRRTAPTARRVVAIDITIEMLAERGALSTRSLSRLFARELGMSPREYHDRYHDRGADAAEDFAVLCNTGDRPAFA